MASQQLHVMNKLRLTFFDKEIVKDDRRASAATNRSSDALPQGSSSEFSAFQGLNISAATSGNGQLIVADSDGSVYVVGRRLSADDISVFQAYEFTTTHLYQLRVPDTNVLVTVGSDDPNNEPIVRIWLLDKLDPSGQPSLARSIKVLRQGRPVQVSCVAAHTDLQHLAVGLVDGSVLLVCHSLT